MTEGQCQEGHEDGGEALWGKTQAVTEGQCQEGHEDGGEAPWGKTQVVTEDSDRRDMKARKIRGEWATDREKWKGFYKTR